MKKCIILLFALAVFGMAIADTLTIGQGTEHLPYPISCWYGYQRSASIYKAYEIGVLGTITQISYQAQNTTTSWIPIKVYMKMTTATSLLPAKRWELLTDGLTPIYVGSISGTTAGAWKTFTLSTPFIYTGSNLQILVESNYGGIGNMSSAPRWYYSTADNLHQRIDQNYSAPTYDTGFVNSCRPNVRLEVDNISGMPGVFAANVSTVPFGNVTMHTISAYTDVTVTNVGYQSLTITNVALAGDDPDSFILDMNSNPTPWYLSGGQSATVKVAFNPTEARDYSAELRFNSNIVELLGSGIDRTVYALPHTQNFDSCSPPNLPNSWTSINVNNDAVQWETSTLSPYSASNCVSIGYNSTQALNDWLISPPISLQAGSNYCVEFYYRGAYSSYIEKLKVMLGTSNQVADLTTEVFVDEHINFDNYSRAYATFTAPSTGICFLGWHAYSAADQSRIRVDDIRIDQAPIFSLSPDVSQWDFGGVELNVPATKQFTITNTGGSTLDITSVDITDGNNYSTINVAPADFSLATGESTTFKVTYIPTTVESHNGTVTIVHNLGTKTIDLVGLGYDTAPAGSSFENPYQVTLPLAGFTGDTSLYGDNYSSTWVSPSFIYMDGDDMVLQFSLPVDSYLSGTLASTDGGNWIGMCVVNQAPDPVDKAAVLASAISVSGTVATMNATVLPAGTYALIISTYPTPQSFQFTLDLTASPVPTEPELAIDPDTWDFGVLALGNTASKQFTLTNTGGGNLNISSVTVSGDYFSLSEAFTPIDLGLQQSATFTVEYTPQAYGTHAGTITIADNRTNTVIHLSGTATNPTVTTFPWTEGFESVTTPALPPYWNTTEGSTGALKHWASISSDSHGASAAYSGTKFAYLYCYLAQTTYNPYSLITPPINLGSPAKHLSYYYWIGSNTVAEPLFVDISVDLANWTTLYTHSNASNTLAWFKNTISLSTYASSTVYLRFRGVSNYGSGLCDLGIDDVTVENMPTSPVLDYSPTEIVFDAGFVNTASDYQNVVVSNSGVGTLTLLAEDISLEGADSSQFEYTSTGFPAALTTGQSVSIPVRFAPSSAGDKSATLRISYSGTDYDVSLSGVALAENALYEGFEGEAFPPEGWNVTAADAGGTQTWTRSTSSARTGLACAAIRYETAAHDDWLITPQLAVTASDHIFSFWAMNSGTTYQEKFNVKVSTLTNGVADFINVIATGVEPTDNVYSLYSYNLSTFIGQNVFVGIQATETNQLRMFIDDVFGPKRYSPPPPPDPVTLSSPVDGATDLPVEGFEFTWTPADTGGVPAYYQLFLASSAETIYEEVCFDSIPGTSFNPVEDGDMSFHYWDRWFWTVRAVNASDTAVVEPPYHFDIEAGVTITSFPYIEDFDGTWSGTPAAPTGWTVINADNDDRLWSQLATELVSHSAPYTANGSGNTDDYLITPRIDLTGIDIKMKWWDTSQSQSIAQVDSYKVLLSTTDTEIASFTDELVDITCTNEEWTEHTLNLDAYNGQTVYIAFFQYAASDEFYEYDFGIDDFRLDAIVDNDMEVFSVSDLLGGFQNTSVTHTVTVRNNGTSTQNSYSVYLKQVGGGTIASETINEELLPDATKTVVFTWTPTALGTIELYAEVVLAGDAVTANNASEPMTFNTYQQGILLESFESGVIPANWTVLNEDGGTQVWDATTVNPRTGTYAASVNYETSSLDNDDWLITPPLQVTSATTDTISFWMRTYSGTNTDPWQVLISTTDTSPASFTMIDSGTGQLGEYVPKSYSLDSYGNAVVYLAIRYMGAYDWSLYVDDFVGPFIFTPTGDGSEADPYQIASLANLLWLRQTPSAWSSYFSQTADIDAQATQSWDEEAGWLPIGTSESDYFAGNYNGNGFSISNLYINRPDTDGIGLFGFTDGAHISNLRLENADFTGRSSAATLIGKADNTSIMQCSATGLVNATRQTVNSNTYAGGLIGRYAAINGNVVDIIDCWTNVSVTGTGDRIGGISGLVLSGFSTIPGGTISISNCYALGSVSGANQLGGLVGRMEATATGIISMSNSYSIAAIISSGTSLGGLIGSYNSGTISSCYWDTESSGMVSSLGGAGRTASQMMHLNSFDTYVGWGFDSNWRLDYGSSVNSGYPYLAWQVDSPLFLAAPSNVVANTGNGTVSLSWDTPPSGTPTGYNVYRDDILLTSRPLILNSYDDSGVTIGATYRYAITAVYTGGESGLSEIVSIVPLNMIALDDPYPADESTCNMPPANLSWSIQLSESFTPQGFKVYLNTSGEFSSDDAYSWVDYIEGQTRYACAEILNLGLAENSTYYWKVVPTDSAPIRNSREDRISATGNSRLELTDTPVWIFHTGTLDFAGGNGTADDPYLVATADQLNNVRNHLGACFSQIADIDLGLAPYNTDSGWLPIGDTTNQFAGTYDGNSHAISNLFIDRPNEYFIGLFGRVEDGNLSNIVIESAQVSGYWYVGMLAGLALSTTVNNCNVAGTVAGSDYVGGLLGTVDSSYISKCCSHGSVSGSSSVAWVGGLIGYINQTGITNSYSTSSVTAFVNSRIGGLGGRVSSSTISNCYSSGSVSALQYSGGLIGYGSRLTVRNSFWDTETSQQLSSFGGTGKSSAEMKDIATYTSLATAGLTIAWDFMDDPYDDTGSEDIWAISSEYNDGYPNLNHHNDLGILSAPELSIAADGTLSWNAVDGADYYTIYASIDPNAAIFTALDTTMNLTWLDPNFPEAKSFYRVSANTNEALGKADRPAFRSATKPAAPAEIFLKPKTRPARVKPLRQ